MDSDRAVRYVVRTTVSRKGAEVRVLSIHSAELQSVEIRFTLSKSCMNGIHLVSSTRHAIGCMLRQHSFSLRQPPVTLPMGGV